MAVLKYIFWDSGVFCTKCLCFSLPGREALYDPGNRAGQMKMIRENNTVMAYTWVENDDQSHWEKVGEVLGGSDKDQQGRTQYEGQVSLKLTNILILFLLLKHWTHV